MRFGKVLLSAELVFPIGEGVVIGLAIPFGKVVLPKEVSPLAPTGSVSGVAIAFGEIVVSKGVGVPSKGLAAAGVVEDSLGEVVMPGLVSDGLDFWIDLVGLLVLDGGD